MSVFKGSERQIQCLKMGYEPERVDLSLKEHFGKWDRKPKDGFEAQRIFLKMGYEPQRVDLSLKEHF